MFSWVRIAVEQRLGCDQKTWGTNPALQGCMFQEFLLQWMQLISVGQTFYRRQLLALPLQHPAPDMNTMHGH